MDTLFVFAAHNTVAAIVLAAIVLIVTHVWRNPPAAHVLWLLVLLRLVAPPMVGVNWPVRGLPMTYPQRRIVTETLQIGGPAGGGSQSADTPASLSSSIDWGRAVLFWLWVGGAVVCGLVAVTRIVRFERLLRGALPAPERLQQLAMDVARTLGVRRACDVRCVDGVAVPFVWWAGGRATIVLPLMMCRQFDEEQVAMILGHELAHLRRRDHWVRVIEMFVASIYWWNPLAWAVRRRIHHAEDLCCDAWVRRAFPEETHRYAEAVLKMAESLGASRGGARLLPASPFVESLSLKARIEMILESRFAPNMSRRSLFALTVLAMLLLPAFVQTRGTQVRADSVDDTPATPASKPDASTSSAFPYTVKFEQGATQFLAGDEITILEIRGTADTFIPGNIYWIKGTYRLASHEQAGISAYTTAMDSADGTGTSFTVQSAIVNKGEGTFTVFLPMSCRGWPHVSFYPRFTGESFGGNYFGTGDSVLKHWWGSEE